MDILYWTKLNPDIQHKATVKKFFNTYIYKLEILATGSAFLRYPETRLEDQLKSRQWQRTINPGGSWRSHRYKDPTPEELELLQRIRDISPDYPSLRFRIEDPHLQVYSEDLSTLHKFAQGTIINGRAKHLESLWTPRDAAAMDLINQGFTLNKKPREHPFKVYVREGRYSKATKQQVLNYLESMPEDVRLPEHFRSHMDRAYESVWNCYFYVKDPAVLTMLALIHPRFVRAVEEFRTPSEP